MSMWAYDRLGSVINGNSGTILCPNPEFIQANGAVRFSVVECLLVSNLGKRQCGVYEFGQAKATIIGPMPGNGGDYYTVELWTTKIEDGTSLFEAILNGTILPTILIPTEQVESNVSATP